MKRLDLLLALAALAACGDDLRGAGGGSPCDDCAPDAGAGGGGDAGPLGSFCDDGNPCTVDLLDGDGCHAAPMADGTPCDDGDLCTLGDRCGAGECTSGSRAEGELEELGALDDLAGRRLALGAGRFVVVTIEDLFRGRVRVVERTADGFATAASWRGDLTMITISDDELIAAVVPATGLVAVTAVSERGLRLFSVTDSQVVSRGEIELSNQVNSISAHGDRAWLCTGNPFAGYQVTLVDIADPDAPVEVGGMSLGAVACGSTAIGSDGDRVYLNTADGVRFIDASPLDTGGDPTLSEVIAPTAGVTINGSRLLLLTATGVRILEEPSLDEVATVPVTAGRIRAATLIGNRLLVEGNRPAGGGNSEVFVAWYRALGGPPVLLDDAVTTTYIGGAFGGTFTSATDGTTLLTGTRAFDLTANRLDELRLPALLPLGFLARTGDGVRTYHGFGAADIDLRDPAAPAFAAGGAFPAPRRLLTVSLDDSLAAPTFAAGRGQGLEDPTRVALDPSNPYFASPLRIDRWTLDDDLDLAGEDHFSLAYEGSSHLLAAGDFIYRLRRPDENHLESVFQAWWIPALGGGAAGVPVFEIPIPAATTARRGFDVDPVARIAAVSTDGEAGPVLLFYDLSVSPPAPLGELATAEVYSQIRVAGTRVVAVGYEHVAFLALDGGEVARLPTIDVFQLQLLAFDGETAYWGQLHIVPGQPTYSVVAAPFGSAEPPPSIAVDAIPRSLVPVDGALAVGFDTRLLTVYPHCPGDRPFAPATDENR